MAELNRVEVEILGQKYTIRSASEPGYVKELAAYLEKRVLELRGRWRRDRTRRGSWRSRRSTSPTSCSGCAMSDARRTGRPAPGWERCATSSTPS